MSEQKQDTENYDAVILGAGISGMTAALTMIDEAKKQGRTPPRILILDGDDRPGGRVKTQPMPADGTPLDMGAHWFHGGPDVNSFYKWAIKRYGPFSNINVDHAEGLGMNYNNTVTPKEDQSKIDDDLYNAWERDVKKDPLARPSMAQIFTEAGRKRNIRQYGALLSQAWEAVQSPSDIDAHEFYSDGETLPGGVQLKDGVDTVVKKMVNELRQNGVTIKSNAIVNNISQAKDGVTMTDQTGETYHAKRGVVTASIGVLQKKGITFSPPQSDAVAKYIDSVEPASATKIVLPMNEEFFKKNNIAANARFGGYKNGEAFFCFAHGAGEPNLLLYLGGDLAVKMDKASPAEARNFSLKTLDEIPALAGYRNYIAGDPVTTHWNTNPLYGCAYSAMKPGHDRPQAGFMQDGLLTYAGEAFAPSDAATMKGAWDSGLKAGTKILSDLALKRRPQNARAAVPS